MALPRWWRSGGVHGGWAAAMALILTLVGPSRAIASAFNQPEGKGVAIVDVTFSGGDRTFNGLGTLSRTSMYRRGDTSAYVEYGVTDDVMAVGRLDLTAIKIDGRPGSRYTGIGPSDLGAQWRLLAFGPAVLAIQGSFHLPGSTDTRNLALGGATSHAAEARGLLGFAFALGGWPAFIDLQGAFRARDAGAPDEIRTDATLGAHVRDDLMILLQVFDTRSIGRGTAWFPRERFTNVEAAAVYDLDQALSIELGAYTTVFGRRALRERGIQTAVWYRF